MIKKKWKNIDNTDGFYQISNTSEVRSKNRYKENNGGKVFVKGRVLKQSVNHKGYKTVSFCYKSKRYSFIVHRLVAKYFIANPEKKDQVNHINLNRKDNRVENLEWVNNRENKHHSRKIKNNGFVGIHKSDSKWCAQINIKGTTYTLGRFKEKEEAQEEYNQALYNWNTKNLIPKIRRQRGFYKKDLSGVILRHYKTLQESKKEGFNPSNVSQAYNYNKIYKGFLWEKLT